MAQIRPFNFTHKVDFTHKVIPPTPLLPPVKKNFQHDNRRGEKEGGGGGERNSDTCVIKLIQ